MSKKQSCSMSSAIRRFAGVCCPSTSWPTRSVTRCTGCACETQPLSLKAWHHFQNRFIYQFLKAETISPKGSRNGPKLQLESAWQPLHPAGKVRGPVRRSHHLCTSFLKLSKCGSFRAVAANSWRPCPWGTARPPCGFVCSFGQGTVWGLVLQRGIFFCLCFTNVLSV